MYTDISIIIPVKDEENNIEKCLQAVYSQKNTESIEIIIIDSGSTDKTLTILTKYEDIKIIKILPEEFGHGKTRNLGVNNAAGKIIVFLNGDAIPADNLWLSNLIEPLKNNPSIIASYSRHLPKADCFLYMARDLTHSMSENSFITDKSKTHNYFVFSTVSAAIRSETIKKFPFQDEIIIAEDQEWGVRMLKNNLKIAYVAESKVTHSHNYNLKQLYKIKYDFGRSNMRFSNKFIAFTWGGVLSIGGCSLKIIKDIPYILKQPISFKSKLKEIYKAATARKTSFLARYQGWLSTGKQV